MIRSGLQMLGALTLIAIVLMLHPQLAPRLPFLKFLPKVTIAPPEVIQQTKEQATLKEDKEKVTPPVQVTPTPQPSPSVNPSPKNRKWGIQYKFNIGEQSE